MEYLANMALALALTRTMLGLPYRADAAEDLERAVRVSRDTNEIRACSESVDSHLMASYPQHPYVSTAKGMHADLCSPNGCILILHIVATWHACHTGFN